MPTLTPAQFASAGGKVSTQGSNYSAYQNFVQNNVQNAVKTQLPTQSPGLLSSLNSLIQPGGAINNLAAGIGTGLEESPVTSATRVAQAGVAATELPKANQQIAQENESTTKVQDLIDQMNATTDPAQKVALANQAKQLLVSASTPDKSSASIALNNLNNPVNELGVTVQPQQGGVKGAEQAAGNFAEGIGEAAGGDLPGVVGDATGLISKGITGAIGTGVSGGLMTGGSALQNPDATAGSVLGATGKGVVAGGLLGAGGAVLPDVASSSLDNIKESVNKVPEVTTPTPMNAITGIGKTATDAESIAQDAIRNPLSEGEQESAVKRGRLSSSSKSGINSKITYEASPQTKLMSNALKPMVEDGRIQAPTSAGAQESNILKTGDEIENQGDKIRQGLQDSDTTAKADSDAEKARIANMSPSEKASYQSIAGDTKVATANQNKLYVKEFRTNLDDVKVPDPVKNDSVMNKNATTLKNAAKKIYQNESDRDGEALLNAKQNFDDYIKDNYGKGFFDKGRNANPWHSYVYGLRDKFTELIADKLPDGKLPDGTTLKDAFLRQHQLINAQDEMTAKFVREYPEGSTKASRFIAQHPMLRRFGMRTAMQIAAAATGTGIAVAAIKKAVSEIGK